MTEYQQQADWNISEWHGKMLIDRDGERIGKLQEVYVDVENDDGRRAHPTQPATRSGPRELGRQFGPGGLSPVIRARRSCASAARRRASARSLARWSSRIRAGLLGRCPYALAL